MNLCLVNVQPPPNNGMHPTADTQGFINSDGLGRRVMPGVRLLGRYSPLLNESAAAAGG